MFKKGNNIFSLLIIILSVFMTSSVNTINAATGVVQQPETNTTGNPVISSEENNKRETQSEPAAPDSSVAASNDWSNKFLSNPKLADKDGKTTDHFGINDITTVEWDFNIPEGTGIKNNDTLTATLPSQINASNLSGPAKDLDGNTIGTVSTKAGSKNVTLTFNNTAETLNKVGYLKGTLYIQTKWDSSAVNSGDNVTVSWPADGDVDGNTPSTTVTIDPTDGPQSDEIVYKWGSIDRDTNDITWDARVNYAGNFKDNPINNAIYTDTIGPNQKLVSGSIKVYTVKYRPNSYVYDDKTEVTPQKVNEIDDTHFSVELGNIVGTYIIEYHTSATDKGISLSYNNKGVLTGNDDTTNSNADESTEILKIGGIVESGKNVTGTKTWSGDTEATRPKSIVINLLANIGDNNTFETVESKVVTGPDWKYSFTNLHTLKSDGSPILYKVSEAENPNDSTSKLIKNYKSVNSLSNYDITNTLNSAGNDKQSFTVNKTWSGDNETSRPKNVQVQLYDGDNKAYGDPVELSANKDDKTKDWTYTWTDLPKLADGKTYSVQEVNTDSKYDSTVAANNNGATIKNTLKTTKPDSTQLSVNKKWGGDHANNRPTSIIVNLLKNGVKTGQSITLTSDNNWSGTFTGLDSNSIKDYSVDEDTVTGYKSEISAITSNDSGNSVTITNTYTPGTVNPPTNPPTDHNNKTISVRKIWNDKNDQDGIRPESVQVQLFANGNTQGDPITLNADNNWYHAWNNLNQGTNYTVKEVGTVDGYTSTALTDGNYTAITNTHKPTGSVTPPTDHNDKTISVRKIWNDKNNQDGIRPESVQVQLFANGNAQGDPITLNADNNWYHAWNNLNQGTNYTVKEVGTVDGYTSTALTDGNYTAITNTHTPKTPGNPGTPQTPGTPGNPGNPGTPLTPGTPGTPSTPCTPDIPSIPPYTPSNPPATNKTPDSPFGYLPQTGSKDANIMYTIIGLIILGLVSTYIIKRRSI